MAKILISSLGVGPKNRQNAVDPNYQTARYRMSDGKEYETNFIAYALYQHLQLDGIMFIGTVKSMWERVYKVFNGGVEDEDWVNLGVQIESLDLNSPVDSLDLSAVERVLGERSKCIVIKYGLNEVELEENLDHILKIVDDLQPGDELYIDITHSFRSLSIFLFIVLIFLNDLKQERNITIKGVFYGMLDVTREMDPPHTPVVDLKSLFDLTQWIKGTYSLKSFGNGYLISQLLRAEDEAQLADNIIDLSEVININYVPTIKGRKDALNNSMNNREFKSPFKHLETTLKNFTNKISKQSDREADFQLKLAEWYFENKRYATGYITLAEALITYVCEINGYTDEEQLRSEDIRKAMKDLMHQDGNKNSDLVQLFLRVNPIRRWIAHAGMIEKKKEPINYKRAIKQANKYHQEAKKIFKTGTLNARR